MVDHTSIFRWVQRYAPEIEKRVRWYQGYPSPSWRVDETYVRVGGSWKYLFRAVDKTGRLIDFMLSDRRNACSAQVLGQGPEDDAEMAAGLDHHGQAWILREGDPTLAARRPFVGGRRAPNVEIPEQHHRSRPRRAEAGDPADTWVPDDEDSLRDHQRFRDHADDPSRALRSSRAGRCRRGPLRQQALRSARITAPLTWLRRVQRELMQQSPRRRNSSGRRAEPGDRSHHLLEPKLPGRYRPAHAGPGQPVRTRCCPAHRHSPGNTSASPATSCRTGPGTLP